MNIEQYAKYRQRPIRKLPELLKSILKDKKTIADIGCGDGMFIEAIRKITKAEIWAVDLSEIRLKRIDCEIKVKDNAETLDEIPDGYFDLILSIMVIEHCDDRKALLAMHKKLKPDGTLFLQTVFKKKWAKWYFYGGKLDPTHIREYTDKTLFNGLPYDVVHEEMKLIKYRHIPIFGYYAWTLVLKKKKVEETGEAEH
jgi:ubiquinone/menaquinone biosynthesis C-methylase UbiE